MLKKGKNISYYIFQKYIFALCVLFLANTHIHSQNDNGYWDMYSSFPKYETRAIWMGTIGGIDWPRNKINVNFKSNNWKAQQDRHIAKQKQELIDILDKLQRANINTIILQTRIRGSVIYPSKIEPWDDCLTGYCNRDPGYDPLEFAINECHKRGMELHAWLVTIPIGTSTKQKKLGAKALIKTHPELCKTVGGEVFMIPGKKGTAEYMATLCKEIVSRYDVDGISLDYIRYPEKEYRFSDDELYKQNAGSNHLTKAEWRRNNISNIVKAVHDAVKPIKPWIKLSSSPLGRYNDLSRYPARGWDCFNTVYQDPKLWLANNWQDMLFPMMYFQGNLFYPFVFNWKEISSEHPIAAGLGIYFLDPKEGKNWTLNDVRAQIYTARNSKMGGVCFYRSYYLTNNYKGIYNTVCNEIFPYPALPQPMRWMGYTEIPEIPTNLERKNNCLTWNKVTSAKTHITYNIYASYTTPVDITKGENLIAVRVQDNSFYIQDSNLYYAVTAMDCYGNESEATFEASVVDKTPIINKDITYRTKVNNAIKKHFYTYINAKEKKKKKKKK